MNMQYDIADQLDQLWAIGHTGSSESRYEQVKALSEEPVMRHTTLTYDLSSVNQILMQISQLQNAVNTTKQSLQDAVVIINTLRPDNT